MKIKNTVILGLLITALCLPAFGQNTVVTYQGRVTTDGTDFTGPGQFKFALVTVTNSATATTATATATTSGGFVTIITVTFGGSGYVTPPIVTITGGGGSGATATANLTGGAVSSVTVNTTGSGYTSPPMVTLAPPPDTIAYTTYWSNDGTSNAGSEPTATVNLPVSNGLFTARLGDLLANMTAFPADLFQQPNLHLRIWFNDGVNGFAALQPTQPLTAAPYAFVAGTASNLLGTVSATSLSGTYSGVVTFNNPSNSFSGNGAGLTALDAAQLTSGIVSDARLSANVSLLGPNISTGEIVDGTILNADLNAAAAIVDTKLATIATAGKVADSAVSANVALLNRTPQTFTGTNVFNNRVGINTATPAAALDVAGSTVIRGLISPAGTVATNLLNLGSGFTADGFRNGISFYEGSGNPAMMLGYDGTVSGTANNALRIYDINGNALFSFLNGGRMGIGTNNPQSALQVLGTVTATAFSGDGSQLAGIIPPPGMVLIPAGSFTMGNSIGDADITDASPVSVTVSAFYMDANEVTWSQWQSVYYWATNHGYGFVNRGDGKAVNHPVVVVSWYDCVKWSNARSQQAGRTPVYYTDAGLTQVYTNGQMTTLYPNWTASGYRLPTEAEWEKAARGGLSGQRFPWGNVINQNLANYYGDIGNPAYDLGPTGVNAIGSIGGISPAPTSPVGSFAANGYGLNDMAGNVTEWCWDWYGPPYAGGSDPHGPSGPLSYRVVRGGSCGRYASEARCAYRGGISPSSGGTLAEYGFRCVRGL